MLPLKGVFLIQTPPQQPKRRERRKRFEWGLSYKGSQTVLTGQISGRGDLYISDGNKGHMPSALSFEASGLL